MSYSVKSSVHVTRVHVMRNGMALCRVPAVTVWQTDIGPANCKTCAVMLERELKQNDGKSKIANRKRGKRMSKKMMSELEKTEDFAGMVNLLAVFSEAQNRMDELEAEVNGELLELVDHKKKDYAVFQEALTKAEAALEMIVRRHPEWFESKKSIKTPYGTAKLHSSSKVVPVNDEATVKLLRAEEKANPEFKAGDYIRVSEVPNLEALEGLADEVLVRFMVKRVKEQKFSVTAAKLDMGKAVREAVGASERQSVRA